MRLHRRTVLLSAALPVLMSLSCSAAEPSADTKPLRILFVGNSYTNGSWKAITEVFQGHDLQRHTRGGAKLEAWAKDEKLHEKIKSGKWDFVVLQEQSQMPSLTEPFVKRFMDGAMKLDERIRASGAKTVLFMTWGRRDGDKRNKQLNPTFEAMQAKLSKNYRAAAEKLNARVAPIGDVFAEIKNSHGDLFPKLYKGDGSHPSGLGGVAAAYTLHYALIGPVPPAGLPPPPRFEDCTYPADEVQAMLLGLEERPLVVASVPRQARFEKRLAAIGQGDHARVDPVDARHRLVDAVVVEVHDRRTRRQIGQVTFRVEGRKRTGAHRRRRRDVVR